MDLEEEASAEEAEAAEAASATEAEVATEVDVEEALVAEVLQEAEVPHEVAEEVLVPEPRSSFNLTSDSKVSMSSVERTTLSSPRISTQESLSTMKNV